MAVPWEAPTNRATGITSSSITAGANALGDEIDNGTNLDRWAAFELTFTCSSAPTANTVVELYLIHALDGTNYEDGDATPTDPGKAPVAVFAARNVTSAQKVSVTGVPLPPFKFKSLLKSELDQNATSVALDCETYKENPS